MSEPPEEPHLRSEPTILSPTSPKPIHFPTPTNIPVLEMQTDVGFNQTEAHMSDATRNTEVRADFWRDPKEQADATDHVSPFSTGGEALQSAVDGVTETASEQGPTTADGAHSNDQITTAEDPQPAQISDVTSHEADGQSDTIQAIQASSDPSVPAAEALDPTQTAAQTQLEAADVGTASSAQAVDNGVDVQALLDTLQTAPATATNDADPSASTVDGMNMLPSIVTSQTPNQYAEPNAPGTDDPSSAHSASGLGAPPSGLPPRPPPQEQPLIHPNYVHSQHIRDYHPHAAHPAFQPHARSGSSGNVADPTSKNFVPPVHSPTSTATPGASQTSGYPSNLAIPGSAPFSNSQQMSPYMPGAEAFATSPDNNSGFTTSPQTMYTTQYLSNANTPVDGGHDLKSRGGDAMRPEDRRWENEVERKYDRFIEDERKYVSEGRWEQFPQGSRLFVGNLSSEKVTKRDIFHVFHTYGDLAQISIKQAYGFVQFLRTEDCVRALEREQGTQIRDKKIHLEVSKPQKNRPQNQQQRRSRSPPDNNRGRPSSNVDRYTSGARGGNNNNRNGGARDGYRPGYRSPSPRGYRDRFDERPRRSRSPDYSRGGRYRSPSPRRDVDDDLPLPKRAPRDVPDVQIVVLDNLDRDFISWIEQAFSSRSVRVDVLILSPRLSEQAVIRRQIMEGVIAVVKLTRQNQNTGKIGLQIFDRSQGVNNVRFEEYDGLDPNIIVELVLRAKSAQRPQSSAGSYGGYGAQHSYGAPPPMPPPPQQQQYGSYASQQPQYGQQPQHPSYTPGYGHAPLPPQSAPPPNVPPHLQNLITNMDPNNLQSLLSAMGNTPQSANSAAHLYNNPSHPNSAVVAQLQNNPALAGYVQQQAQHNAQQSGGSAVNMQDILARLGSYQQ